jgi:hypothetical protein
MKRSVFMLIVAVLGFLFGLMLLLVPVKAGEGFGFAPSAQTDVLFRAMGGMIFSAGLLNLMVRSHPDSPTLAAVLWFNVATHGLSLIVDMMGVSAGTMELSRIAVSLITHVFVIIGSTMYLMLMRKSA